MIKDRRNKSRPWIKKRISKDNIVAEDITQDGKPKKGSIRDTNQGSPKGSLRQGSKTNLRDSVRSSMKEFHVEGGQPPTETSKRRFQFKLDAEYLKYLPYITGENEISRIKVH